MLAVANAGSRSGPQIQKGHRRSMQVPVLSARGI